MKQAESICDVPAWPPGRTFGESPNGVHEFRSYGTQESPTPKRASPQNLSCPEIPSCSQLAPSAGVSPLTLSLQSGHVPALPHHLLVLSQVTKSEWPHFFWCLAVLVPGSPQISLPVWGWKHTSRCYRADHQAGCLPAASRSLRHFSMPLILSNLII